MKRLALLCLVAVGAAIVSAPALAEDLQCDRLFEAGPRRDACVSALIAKPNLGEEALRAAVADRLLTDAQRAEIEKRRLAAVAKAEKHQTVMQLKYLRPGMTIAEAFEIYPNLPCSPVKAKEVTGCHYERKPFAEDFQRIDELDTLAGMGTLKWKMEFEPNGRLAWLRVHMASGAFDDLVIALAVKYGKAAMSVREYQNAFGAKFQGKVARWEKGGNALQVSEYAGTKDELAILLVSRAGLAAVEKQRETEAKKGARDL